MASRIKQKDPRNVKRRVYFTCVDTAALQTRLQASDMSGAFTCYLTKNGGAPALSTNQPVEVSAANMKGTFYLELTAAECDTIGFVAIKISNAGGAKTMEPREEEVEIEQAYFATVQAGTLTSNAFTTDRTEADNFWRDALAIAVTGALAGQVKKLGSSANAAGLLTLATGLFFTAAPVAGDIFELIDR